MRFSEITREAVLQALRECDQMGRDRFLEHYGFKRARSYYLSFDGTLYDSKAILGVAHKYQFPSDGPLRPINFSGGRSTVQAILERLGFQVVVK